MANGEWLSPLIPGARRFYLARATNRVGAKSASTVNCYGRPTSVLTPILPGLERGHSMPVNVNEIIRKLSPAERKKVEDRATELIAEEMSLRDLRKARKLTQARVAKTLGITQDTVSPLDIYPHPNGVFLELRRGPPATD